MTTTHEEEAYELAGSLTPESRQDQVRATRCKDRVAVETSCLSSGLEPRPSDLAFSGHSSPITQSVNFALILVTFALGMIVDQRGGLAGQLAVSVWTWGVFFWLLRTSPREWRLPFYACLVWATAGEILLSLVWVLYTYRLANIPFFIPPGHVLVFYLGLVLAPRVPRAFVVLVPVAAIGYAAFALNNGSDTISIPLTVLFILCMQQPEGRRRYAVIFVASLMVEVYGTWNGNWVWHRDVPYLGLSSANPPLAAGAFYCALDVLVGMTVRGLKRLPRMASSPRLTVST
jgi:hypothetical protein